MSSKIVVILGATGNQGGSVVDTFLEEGSGWQVRGVTRNKSSPKAQSLASRGVQLVEADLSQPSTLRGAFDGASVVFAVTDFMGIYIDQTKQTTPGLARNAWAAEVEAQQLKNVIDEVAKVPSLERFVFSSLSKVSKWSNGKYTHVYHFEGKANAEDYGRQQHPDLWAKTSVLQGGLFLEVLTTERDRPRKVEGSQLVKVSLPLNPDYKIPWIAAREDVGPLVKALVSSDPGNNLLAYRQWATFREVAAMLADVTGLHVEVNAITVDQWAADNGLPADLNVEFTEHFKYWEEFGFEAQDDPPMVHPSQLQAAVQLPQIMDWLARQDWPTIME